MSATSPYGSIAPRLIERGYAAIPVVPETKVPGTLRGGAWVKMHDWTKKYSKRLPSEREVETWSESPEGGVCVVCGESSQYLLGIDIDYEPAMAAVIAAIPHSIVAKKGRKGLTLFYRSTVKSEPIPIWLPDGTSTRAVDVLGSGRQTVLPPTVHPDTGLAYVWCGEAALDEVDPQHLPEFTAEDLARLKDALRPFGYRDSPPPKKMNGASIDYDDSHPYSIMNGRALSNLDAWVPKLRLQGCKRNGSGYRAIADWRPSNSGKPPEKRNLNLSFSPQGIRDFGADKGYSPIDLLVACNAAVCASDAYVWLSDALGDNGMVYSGPKEPLEEFQSKTRETNGVHKEEPSSAIIVNSPPSAPPWKAPAFDHTACPGLVGRIAEWILASSTYQQPLFAMGAALSIVGTVAGRHIMGPTSSGTHLYVICAAPTGSGKDHPLQSVSAILDAAKLGSNLCLGRGNFTSASAVEKLVLRQPACVCPIDEFGVFLFKGKARTASTHEMAVPGLLRQLWSSSFKIVPGIERASEEGKTIYWPALSIFGASTITEFYAALSSMDASNGVLNRFLVLENSVRPEPVDPSVDSGEVPAEICQGLHDIYYRTGDAEAQFRSAGDVRVTGQPLKVRWGGGAEKEFKDLQKEVTALIDRGGLYENVFPRTAEMAVRIATIRAVGVDTHSPVVTVEDMRWARALSMHSANTMLEGARDRIAENAHNENMNKVILFMKTTAGLPLEIRQIQQRFGRQLKSRDIRETLGQLCEMGIVEMVHEPDARSQAGRQKQLFRWAGETVH
jgi:hypothetical protein